MASEFMKEIKSIQKKFLFQVVSISLSGLTQILTIWKVTSTRSSRVYWRIHPLHYYFKISCEKLLQMSQQFKLWCFFSPWVLSPYWWRVFVYCLHQSGQIQGVEKKKDAIFQRSDISNLWWGVWRAFQSEGPCTLSHPVRFSPFSEIQ